MNSAKWQEIKEVLAATLDLPENERREFLAQENNNEIKTEVGKLLDAYDKSGGFIEKPFLLEYDLAENGFEEDFTEKQIDDYFILKKIGAGGMGAVYLAEHRGESFTQKVAIKLIKRGMDTNAVLKRFLMERQILAGLEHPNIARLLDGGSTENGLPYFVLEYVEGDSVKHFCDKHEFAARERLELFQKICTAVSYAHQKLIIHRDLKPSNILITEAGEPKLLDFGIAKLLSPDWNTDTIEATMTNFRLMTPEYASPEQLRGQLTTTATDVYSLGIVLYELLTGTRPFKFESNNPVEISEAILTQEPLRPSSAACSGIRDRSSKVYKETEKNGGQPTTDTGQFLNSKLKTQNSKLLLGDLDNIILKAIRREPERRYQSVEEFCDDIHRYLNNLPVKATADSRSYRIGKFYTRHRAAVLSGILTAFILLSSTAVTGWQFFVAQRERAKAEQHYNELRNVARSLLTETHTALDKLPESLEIRKSILEKSVAVLDSLANDEMPDADFLNELADGYDKLGYIRHWSFRENETALQDFQKSLALREKALAQNSDQVKVRQKIAQTLGNIFEVYSINGDAEKVLAIEKKVLSNYYEIYSLEPENTKNLADISVESERMGDFLKDAGRENESSENYKQSIKFIDHAIENQKNNLATLEDQTRLVRFLMQKGSLSQKFAYDDEALQIYGQAAELAEKIYRADNSQMYAFNHTSRTHRLIADIYRKKGDWRKVLENYRFSLNWLEQNKHNPQLDLKNVPYGIAIFSVREGIALDKLGQKRAGAIKVEEGLKLYREFLKPYAKDATIIINAPEFLDIISDFYTETGQTEKGLEIWDEFIGRVEIFTEKNPDDAGILKSLSYAYRKKGDVLSGLDSRILKTKNTKAKNLPVAKAFYKKSLEILRKTLLISPSNFATEKVETDLIDRIKSCG